MPKKKRAKSTVNGHAKDHRIAIRVPMEMYDLLQSAAGRIGLNVSDMARMYLEIGMRHPIEVPPLRRP